MAINFNWQGKSVLVLTVVILVLGALLTNLVIREAEREKLARERDFDWERQRFATILSGEIDSLFSGLEAKITSATAGVHYQKDSRELSEICVRIAKEENLIDDIFLVKESNEIVFPLRNPLIFASERKRQASIVLAQIESLELFKSAETAEFANRNLPLAIFSYRTLLDTVPDDSSRALVLNRLARCYLKSGNINQGLRTYKTILENFSNELSEEGIYLGIIASYQICRITEKNEPVNTGPVLLEFFSNLVEDLWPLDKGAFLYYWNLIKKMSDDLSQNKDDWERSQNFWTQWQQNENQAENKLKRMTEDEDFIARIIPLVQTRMFEFEDRTQKFVRFAETIDKNLYLVCASIVQEKTLLGISINKKILLQTRIHEIMENLPVPDDWIIQLTSATGDIISGEENADQEKLAQGPSFEAGFNGQFPPWRIRIYMRNPLRIQRQLNVRRNVYILIVVLVTAVLFFGGYMVIRSTAKELELAKLKSEFVATVSHEFRTPLMSIRYLSEMLDTGRVREEEKKKLYYGKIHKESERLRRLIENMLDFSKIEAGMKKYKFDNLSVREMMEEIVGRFHEYISDKKVILECEIRDRLPEIFADKDAISTALLNLLDNAVKYSGKNPVIYLRADVEDDNIFFEVEDKGPGIGKEEQKKVFGKFYRTAGPANTNIEGSGIGLTLVDHIAKAHGGNVQMESMPGQGTRVRIQLPISQKGKNDD